MTELNNSPEQREQQKGHRLEYAYAAPDAIAVYPILGSLVRALGKGWRVLVVAPKLQHFEFQQFRQTLQRPDQLEIISVDELANRSVTDQSGFELVVSLYADPDHNSIIRNSPQILGHSHVMTVDQQPDPREYDLISEFEADKLQPKGVLAITGNNQGGGGKGKTTTAIGLATAAFLQGGKVAVVQWFKERKSGKKTWLIGEHNFPTLLQEPDRFAFYPMGSGFVGSPNLDREPNELAHQRKAREGVALAQELIESGEYAVIVLDEFIDTLKEVMAYLPHSLLALQEVQALLELAQSSATQVVVTGRQITPEWADYIGEAIVIAEKKHPWSSKQKGAVSGLDF